MMIVLPNTNSKKSIIRTSITLISLLFTTTIIKAQIFSADFDFGAGSSYIVENIQSSDQFQYNPSFAMKGAITYTSLDSYFGIKLQLLHVSTTFDGTSGWYNYYGEVNTFTTSLLLTHINNTKKWNFGYNFGLGYTLEDYQSNRYKEYQNDLRRYMSITASGIVSVKTGDRFNVKLTPTVLWTDPINSFRTENWYSAREDVSVLLLIGFEYRLN